MPEEKQEHSPAESTQEVPQQIYRRASLERLANPEQLDNLLVVATPKAWAALLSVMGAIAAVLVWAIYGSIPISVEGRGILMNPKGQLFSVQSPMRGTVKAIEVKEGSKVHIGSPIAEIFDPQQAIKLKIASRQIAAWTKELTRLKGGAQGALQDSTVSAENALAQVAGEKHLFQFQGEQELLKALSALNQVRSSANGTVLELLVNLGDHVEEGTPLASLEYLSQGAAHYIFYGYFPIEKGKSILPGTAMHMEISTVDFQQYGYLLGTVTEVSHYAVSKESVYRNIHNKELAEYLMGNGSAVIQVMVEPQIDPLTGKYHWTSGRNPPSALSTGTICKMQAILERIRPIYYLLPLSEFKHSSQTICPCPEGKG